MIELFGEQGWACCAVDQSIAAIGVKRFPSVCRDGFHKTGPCRALRERCLDDNVGRARATCQSVLPDRLGDIALARRILDVLFSPSMDTPRQKLIAVLDEYETLYPDEIFVIDRIRGLVTEHGNCFGRTCMPGHITGSAWIVSADFSLTLMTHHRKLDRWLQLGGHADGETAPHRVALREAREESGINDFRFFLHGGRLLPLDVDVHVIPARGDEPAHEHHDLRYLLIASTGETIRVSPESHALRWFTSEELAGVTREESVWRMHRKAAVWLCDRSRSEVGNGENT